MGEVACELDALFDEPRAEGSRWTRVNIGEALAGVPTPLTWSVWRRAMEHGFWRSQIQLEVAARAEYGRVRVTNLAAGWPAISVDVTTEQIGRLPGYDADAFAKQYFGFERDPDRPPPIAISWGVVARTAWWAPRAPRTLALLGRRVARVAADSEAVRQTEAFGAPAPDPVAALEVALGRFVDAMAVHTLQGIVCQGAYEQVTARAGLHTSQLVTGDGALIESELARDLWSMAGRRLDEQAFLRRHGFHGPSEGELSVPSWRADPAPLRVATAGLAGARRDRAAPKGPHRQRCHRAATETELLASLTPRRRIELRVMLHVARRLVLQREAGKSAFLRHLDVIRRHAVDIDPELWWCTLDEVLAGTRPKVKMVGERTTRRAALAGFEPALSFSAGPGGTIARGPVTDTVDGRVRGVGASPGTVTGRVRIVLEPAALRSPRTKCS